MLAKITSLLFLLFVFSLGLMQPSIRTSATSVQISDLIYALFSISLLIAVLKGSIPFKFDRYLYLAAIFATALTLSAVFSIDPAASSVKLAGKLYLATIPFAAFLMIRTREDLGRALKAWLAATAVCASVGVISAMLFYVDRDNPLLGYTLFHYGTLPPGNYPRIASTFVNANMLANYLNVGALIVVVARTLDVIGRGAAVVLLIMIGVCAALTISPGIGGFLVAGGLALLFCKELEARLKPLIRNSVAATLIALSVLFVAVSAVSTARQPDALFSIGVADRVLEPSARFMTWRGAFGTFIENPVFGRGVGLDTCYEKYVDLSGRAQTLTDAHNTYLNVAADSGALGLASMLLIALFFARRVTDADPATRLLAIAFICGFLYQGLTGSFEDARHLWLLMGLILGRQRISEV